MTHQTNYLHIDFFSLRTWFIWSILWKTKEDSHRPKYTTSFKPSKVATPKISTFSPLCMLLLQFVWIIFFILGDRKQFFVKVYRYPEVLFNCRVLAVFETSELKEFGILYFISRVTAVLMAKWTPLISWSSHTPVKFSSLFSVFLYKWNVSLEACFFYCDIYVFSKSLNKMRTRSCI